MGDAPGHRFRLLEAYVEHSPFARLLGMQVATLEAGRAVARLPFDDTLATYGNVVHGGALASLMDLSATLAAWTAADLERVVGGGTVTLAISYISPAAGTDLIAESRVRRAGRKLAFCTVDVQADDGTAVAAAEATYAYKTRSAS